MAYSKEIRHFIASTKKRAAKYNISCKLIPTAYVKIGGMECSGFFDEPEFEKTGKFGKARLIVATGKTLEQWLPIMVHESCHMDQFIEKSDIWNSTKISGIDAFDLVDLWLGGKIELTKAQAKEYMLKIMTVELDCEIRSVNKIKKFNLPINLPNYIREANSYLYFYYTVLKNREWKHNESLSAAPYCSDSFQELNKYLLPSKKILQSYK